MDAVLEKGATGRLESSLRYLARRKYRISQDVAEDLVQSALLTYLEVRHRYPKTEEHLRVLVGIFRNKCREHIGRAVRATKGRQALRETAVAGIAGVAAARTEATKSEGVLGELVNREEGRRILDALANLRPQAREMFHLITVEGLSRKELMHRFGLNANTFDSRLHTYRKELRDILDRRDLSS